MVAKFGTNTSDATFKLIFVRKIIQVRELLQYQALPKSWHAQIFLVDLKRCTKANKSDN